jgi:hypothetical protein
LDYSIEGNCVTIGACIPTLYPLIKRIFGARVLGGSTPKNSNQKQGGPKDNNTIVTIGASPRKKKPAKDTLLDLSQLDTVNEDNKYIALEERSSHGSASELRDNDTSTKHQDLEEGGHVLEQNLYPPESAF